MNQLPPFFFSCDWGTSSFRLRLVGTAECKILEEVASAYGVKSIASQVAQGSATGDREDAFYSYLKCQLNEMATLHPSAALNAPVIISGMASSSVGWREVPYATVPFAVDGTGARVERFDLASLSSGTHPVMLVSGLASVSDMMRGEETEVVGIFALPGMAALARGCRIILPGTHSKHITVAQGAIMSFHTYMTGELFQVLTEHSVLRFTTQAGDTQPNLQAFQEGVETARASGVLRSLFQTRSKAVLAGRPGTDNRSFLSGLLIGSELAELRSLNDSTPVVIAAAGTLSPPYQRAAQILGLSPQVQCLETAQMQQVTILGHRQLLQQL